MDSRRLPSMRSKPENTQMKTPHSEQDHSKNVGDVLRHANIAELRYRILQMESTATPEAVRKAEFRMYEAERDLVNEISSEPDVTLRNSKDQHNDRISN